MFADGRESSMPDFFAIRKRTDREFAPHRPCIPCGMRIFSNVTFSFRPVSRRNMPRILSFCRVLTDECRSDDVFLSSLRFMHHVSGGISRIFSSRFLPWSWEQHAPPAPAHEPVPLTNKSFRKEDGGAGEGGKPFFKRGSSFPRISPPLSSKKASGF